MKIEPRAFGTSGLVRDWLAGRGAAGSFLQGHPHHPEHYPALARAQDRGFSREQRERVASALEGGGPGGAARLERFVEDEGFVVTTGQQPIIFGGPLYVVYKALTAIALAEHLERQLGRPVLPVFWIASEDHDWEEARSVRLLDRGNELRTVALPTRPVGSIEGDPATSPALHRIVPGSALPAALDTLLGHLPDTDFSPRWRELLREACTAEATLPHAFARIIEPLLGSRGLFHLQSHAPELKRATSTLLLEELEASERSEALLADRAREIESAGYGVQVPILEGATNLFLEGPSGRERLMREASGFRLRRSGEGWSHSAIRTRVEEDPASLSPNVLLRPVVESAFLPTLAYVAGPGEAAYLAQNAALFELHGVPRPAVHPRLSVDLLESKVAKVLEKYRLDPEALARPHHELAGAILREDLPEGVSSALSAFRGALAQRSGELKEAVAAIDPTLQNSVDTVRTQGFAQLQEVERKVVSALKRENEIALAQLEKAQRHLYPGGAPQERTLSFWYYLFRYGDDLIGRLAREAAIPTGSAEPVR